MRSLRSRLRQAVLTAMPLAVTACAGTSPLGDKSAASSSSGGTSGSGAACGEAGEGCATCDPVADVCSSQYTNGWCRPTCNDCGGCTHTEVAVSPTLAGGLVPGVSIGRGFVIDACTTFCGGPDAGPFVTECHVEAQPDGSARTNPSGAILVSCAWTEPNPSCGPGSHPCVACDPIREVCVPSTGQCQTQSVCGGAESSPTLAAQTPNSTDGTLSSTLCGEICTPPTDGGFAHGAASSCFASYDSQGNPQLCEGLETIECFWPELCEGRQPEGFVPARRTPGLGGYLARAATLEAASIAAFRRLERELNSWGAPPALAARARTAARDEIRHARTMTLLAGRAGERPARVSRLRFAPRPLVEAAMENAVEGCVRETFGAAVALWQSAQASDPELRLALATIAEEEASHAELAMDVDAWVQSQLQPSEREAVEDTRRRAIRELAAGVGTSLDESVAEAAGLPTGDEAAALFRAVSHQLDWA